MLTFLTLVFIAVAILMILVVLVQRGRGGGLAGAFGSGGGSTSAFGTKTGDVFTTATVVLFVVFMLLAIWLNMKFRDTKDAIRGGVPETQPAEILQSTPAPAGAVGTPPATKGWSASHPQVETGPPTPSTMPAALPKIPPTTATQPK